MLPTRDPLQNKRPTQTESRGWKQTFQANRQEKKKKARVALIISERRDFKKRAIRRDLEGHFMTLKRIIQQEDVNTVNINVGCLYIYNVCSLDGFFP